MGNESPPHMSSNIINYMHLNLQIKMPKHKSRSEIGLLNTLQGVPAGRRQRRRTALLLLRRQGAHPQALQGAKVPRGPQG